jgi:hypothetical protein
MLCLLVRVLVYDCTTTTTTYYNITSQGHSATTALHNSQGHSATTAQL